jgi:hypothetical protein
LEQPRRRRIALIGAAAAVAVVIGISTWTGRRSAGTTGAGAASVEQIVSADSPILAEVLNATSRRGLARTVTRQLRQRGVDVVYFGTASGKPAAETEILVRRGDDTAPALRVARALGVGKVRVAPAPERRVDLTVLIGQDYTPPPAPRP